MAKPIIDRQDIRAVVKVMKSDGLAQGPEAAAFEKEFPKFVQDRDCVAVNSGT